MMGLYELQILDSYDNKTYFDGQCGSIYKQTPPLVNVCRKPGGWQSYDVLWEAPRFKSDSAPSNGLRHGGSLMLQEQRQLVLGTVSRACSVGDGVPEHVLAYYFSETGPIMFAVSQ